VSCMPKTTNDEVMVAYTMLHHVLFYELQIQFCATQFHPSVNVNCSSIHVTV